MCSRDRADVCLLVGFGRAVVARVAAQPLHGHPIADGPHIREVVRDQQYGEAALAQSLDEREHLGRQQVEAEPDLDGDGRVTADERIESWCRANADGVARAESQLTGILGLEKPTIAALSVALRSLRSVVRSGG